MLSSFVDGFGGFGKNQQATAATNPYSYKNVPNVMRIGAGELPKLPGCKTKPGRGQYLVSNTPFACKPKMRTRKNGMAESKTTYLLLPQNL